MDWLLPVIAGGLLLVFVIGRSATLRRTREMKAWAEQRGLTLVAGPDRRIGITFLEVPLIGSGRAGARNHAVGNWQGREVHAFDLVVGPDAEDGAQGASRYTCVLLKADLPLIPLCIRPHDVDDRLAVDLGLEPVDIASAALAAEFQISSPDHQWARDLLHDEVVADLLARPRWRLELGGWYCLVAAPGRLDADCLDEALAMAGSFLDGIAETARREILGAAFPERPNAD